MKFHVHIYRVLDMRELDIEAVNETEAKEKAKDIDRDNSTYSNSDCNKIILAFEEIQ